MTIMGRVVEITNDAYLLDTEQGIPFSCEHNVHLWTIDDAKDGDILTSIGFHSNCTFIFNGLDNWKFEEPNGNRVVATGYCCLTTSADKMEFGIQGPDCIEVNTIKPATKIQRDLLFEKIHEAGYEWDANSKQLLSLKAEPSNEQKPAWNEEDDYLLNETVQHLEELIRIDKAKHCSVDVQYYQRDIDWIKSIKERIGGKV